MNNLLQLLTKRIITFIIKPILNWYLRSDRAFHYEDIHLNIPPSVFHPGFFFSTKYLLTFLKEFDFENKTILELGCGSGLIAIWLANHGAKVTASDINKTAIDALHNNAEKNDVAINIIYSDLFEKINPQNYDWIIINPPFYKGKPHNDNDLAWYAGDNLEYFKKLFLSLSDYIGPVTKTVMILSSDCNLDSIYSIASQNKFDLKIKMQKNIIIENLYIFEIENTA